MVEVEPPLTAPPPSPQLWDTMGRAGQGYPRVWPVSVAGQLGTALGPWERAETGVGTGCDP